MMLGHPGYIYAIMLAQFVHSGEPVIKIGRTDDYEGRMKGYTKGFVRIFLMYCDSPRETELDIILLFQRRFKARTDIGREYFEGDVVSMATLLANVVSSTLVGGSFRPNMVKGAFRMPPTPDDRRTNDDCLSDFVDLCIKRVPADLAPMPEPTLGIDEAFEEFKQWVRTNLVPIKVPKKGVVQSYLDDTLGQGTMVRGSYVYRGFRLKDKSPRATEEELDGL